MIEFNANICAKETIGNCITNCTKNIECFSNKYYNNYCIFNNETNIVHCDDIYKTPKLFRTKNSYMYCDKAYLDTCVNNDECSSKICGKKGYCLIQDNGPNENEGLAVASELFIYIFIIIIIISFYIFIYIIWKLYKKNK